MACANWAATIKRNLKSQPRIFHPPAPVEVKKAGYFAFVQTPLLGYNQSKPSPTAAPMESSVYHQ